MAGQTQGPPELNGSRPPQLAASSDFGAIRTSPICHEAGGPLYVFFGLRLILRKRHPFPNDFPACQHRAANPASWRIVAKEFRSPAVGRREPMTYFHQCGRALLLGQRHVGVRRRSRGDGRSVRDGTMHTQGRPLPAVGHAQAQGRIFQFHCALRLTVDRGWARSAPETGSEHARDNRRKFRKAASANNTLHFCKQFNHPCNGDKISGFGLPIN
jgi:hypothetical protein